MTAYIDPDRENWATFKALPRDTPLRMLNLIRFRDVAAYPADHPDHASGRTGAEAYAIYKQAFQKLAEPLGAAMVWEGPMECVVTGPPGEWDEAFVMGYPSGHAFIAMLKDPVYVEQVLPHRSAAVADSRLIRFGA